MAEGCSRSSTNKHITDGAKKSFQSSSDRKSIETTSPTSQDHTKPSNITNLQHLSPSTSQISLIEIDTGEVPKNAAEINSKFEDGNNHNSISKDKEKLRAVKLKVGERKNVKKSNDNLKYNQDNSQEDSIQTAKVEPEYWTKELDNMVGI